MRDIDGVSVDEDLIVISEASQVFQPLNLVVRIGDERFIKCGQHRRSLHDNVRLLRVGAQALQANEGLAGVEPSPRVVVVEPFAGTEGLAAMVVKTGAKLVLGLREVRGVAG